MHHHYSYLEPVDGEINLFLERSKKKVKITAGCRQEECTLFPADISKEQASAILREFVDYNCDTCPAEIITEIDDFKKTLEKVKIFRRITYCSDTGITKIETVISRKVHLFIRRIQMK